MEHVELEHISKAYGRQVVLDDISLSVKKGEVIALLGPNGVGKTTLMREILSRCPWRHGYLPELNPLYDDMYVREYLQVMLRLEQPGTSGTAGTSGQSDKDIVEDLITRVGLTPEANKRIRQLSKGYKQRVGLAQAMLGNPELLILDEPTTGLDPNQLVDIRALIRDLGRDRTVIISTHILQEVREMCNRVWILSHGKIRVDLPIDEIDDLETLFIENVR